MTRERDHHGFDAPAPLGHPGRIGLPDGHGAGPEIGERLPGIGHTSVPIQACLYKRTYASVPRLFTYGLHQCIESVTH